MSNITGRINLSTQWNTRAFTYHPYLLAGVTALLVFIAFLTEIVVFSLTGVASPFLFFFAAIVMSAWVGGYRAGVLATLLSSFLAYVFFIEPYYTLTIKHTLSFFHSSIFIFEGLLISGLSQNMHLALKNLETKNTELKRSEEKFRLVVETVKDYSIYTLDKDGYIKSWNEGAKNIKGYSAQEVVGKHYSLFFDQEEIEQGKPWKWLIHAMNEGKYQEEGWRIKKDHSKFWANVLVTPIIDDAGSVAGFSVISQDMTERREMERRKDEFISIASHELRTPVTSVKVFTQLLLKMFRNFPNTPATKYLYKMDIQIDKLAGLVNDLLDVTRIQKGIIEFKQESVDLKSLTQEIVENMQTLSEKHKIILKGALKDSIRGDKDRLGQVIINFITNAIKYSPNADTIEVSMAQDGEHAIISVKDFGVGIPEEYSEKIFERFFRVYDDRERTYPGLGMGLFISSEIVKRHGGAIWVDSEVGKGSTFYMSLPIVSV